MNIGRLFIGASRTNDSRGRTFVVASWAYETGYWRWAIYWSAPHGWREAFRLPRLGPCKEMGTKWFGYWGITSFSGWIVLPILGEFVLSTQPPMASQMYRRT